MLKKELLHPYQKRAVNFILEKRNVALFLDLGLGKTVTTLTAIEELMYDKFIVNKVLIVAPLRVCNSVWEQEAANWEHTKILTFSNLSGGKANMLKGLQKRADVYLINRENVKALVEHLGKKWDFDMMVIDESSSFKSHASQRFKALKKVIHKINYTVLLTGTPAPNGYMDLWSQIYLLDGGERLGRTITMYRQKYFVRDFMGYNYEIATGAMKRIEEKIKDIVLSMDAKDYLELPERIDVVMEAPLKGELLKTYKKFEKEMLLNIKAEEKITALNAATLSNKLLQFCSGNVYDEDGNVHHIHDLKIEMLKEVIEDNPNENLFIAYNYKHELEQILKHFPQAVAIDKGGEAIEKWNRGEIKMLLGHPQSTGHGLNLQKGGNTIVWYGFTWSLEYYQQLNARLHRQGQTKPVKVIHLAVGEVEYKLMKTLSKKDIVQSNLLEVLK